MSYCQLCYWNTGVMPFSGKKTYSKYPGYRLFSLSFQLCQRVSAKSMPIQVTAHSSTEKKWNKNPGEFITMEQSRLQ